MRTECPARTWWYPDRHYDNTGHAWMSESEPGDPWDHFYCVNCGAEEITPRECAVKEC